MALKFKSFYENRPEPVCFKPDTETTWVDQSEADRASLKYQLERYGMESLQHQLQQTMSQFGYADTRAIKSYSDLASELAQANEYFMQLPALERKKFGHNPAEFFDSIQKNPKDMFDRGFISKDFAKTLGVEFAEDIPPVDVTPVTPADSAVIEKTDNVTA